jgi:hypothetical protein
MAEGRPHRRDAETRRKTQRKILAQNMVSAGARALPALSGRAQRGRRAQRKTMDGELGWLMGSLGRNSLRGNVDLGSFGSGETGGSERRHPAAVKQTGV